MRYCPKFSGVIRRHEGGITYVAVARCKSWHCDYCAGVNASKLRHNIGAAVRDLAPTMAMFATLTAPGHDRSAKVTYEAIRRAWPKVRQWVLRHYGPFEYALIYERHKDGAYHAHVILFWLLTPHYPKMARKIKRQIKDNAAKWGIGRQVDAQMIEGGVEGVVRYAAKAVVSYMSKAGGTKAGLPKSARLYYLSSGIKAVFVAGTDDEGGTWEFGGLVSIDEALSSEVYSLVDKRLLDSDDFTDSHYWPKRHVDNIDF